MRGWQGILAGGLALIALQVLGTSQGTVQGGKLLEWAATGVRKLLSPEVAAIPYVRPPATSPAPATPQAPDTGSSGPASANLPRNPIITQV